MILKNFIVFEGLDGAGTTTQIKLLKEAYTKNGTLMHTHFTCEPTDGSIGRLIRKALSGSEPFDEKTIAYLFGADRNEHIYGKNGIIEHLNAKKAVFSDLYLFSSLAYQGLAAGKEIAHRINNTFPLPEYLFFFDLPASTAMTRIEQRGEAREVYEKKSFQHAVAQAYTEILTQYEKSSPEMQIIRLNAEEKVEEVQKKIWSIVQDLPKL